MVLKFIKIVRIEILEDLVPFKFDHVGQNGSLELTCNDPSGQRPAVFQGDCLGKGADCLGSCCAFFGFHLQSHCIQKDAQVDI